jgi:hypothetical protein
MTDELLARQCLAEIAENPQAANFLAVLRCDLRRTSNAAKHHRIWKSFVEGISGRTLNDMATNDGHKLNFYRVLFAELNASAQPQAVQADLFADA